MMHFYTSSLTEFYYNFILLYCFCNIQFSNEEKSLSGKMYTNAQMSSYFKKQTLT